MMRNLWPILEPAIVAIVVMLVLTAGMLLLVVLTPAMIPLAVVAAIAIAAWVMVPMVRRWRPPRHPTSFRGDPGHGDEWM